MQDVVINEMKENLILTEKVFEYSDKFKYALPHFHVKEYHKNV